MDCCHLTEAELWDAPEAQIVEMSGRAGSQAPPSVPPPVCPCSNNGGSAVDTGSAVSLGAAPHPQVVPHIMGDVGLRKFS